MPAINVEIADWHKVFNNQIYHRLFNYDTPVEVYYGGAASGKSHGVILKVIVKSCQQWKAPRKVLFLRKVAATLRDTIFADVKSGLDEMGLLPYVKVNMSNFEMRLPNGAVFLFKGMDDPEKIKSIKGISDVVMEEASEFSLDDYMQLGLRLRDPKQVKRQRFLMFNPVSKLNWTYKNFFIGHDNEAVLIHSTYKDNRFLDDSIKRNIEELVKTNSAYYKIYALGEFTTMDKLVFPPEQIKVRRLNPDADELRQLPSYFGLDFGYENDPSVLIHVKVDQKKHELYVLDETYRKHLLNNELATAIKEAGHAKEVITADAAEQKSIEELRRDGITRIRPAKKGPDSIRQGIAFLKQFQWVVDDRCVKTHEELENYTYKKDKRTGEYTNEPVDSYNHVIDSIRYATEAINGLATPKAKLFKNRYI